MWKAYDIRKQIAQVLQRITNYLQTTPTKEICTILVFLNYTSGYLKFLFFLHNWNGFVNGFLKMYILSFFNIFPVAKNLIFANLHKKMQILKWSIRAFQWSIICHILTSNMGFRGGRGVNWPLPHAAYPGFTSTPAGIGLI